jgi:hypothetical protein
LVPLCVGQVKVRLGPGGLDFQRAADALRAVLEASLLALGNAQEMPGVMVLWVNVEGLSVNALCLSQSAGAVMGDRGGHRLGNRCHRS